MERSGYTGFAQSTALTGNVDRLIKDLFCRLGSATSCTAAAVGGYGRQDLCPHSDIDILLLAGGRSGRDAADRIVSGVIYPLWDSGFNASYSVRTVKDALKDSETDFFLKTSLLTTRFIAGDELLYNDLKLKLAKISGKEKWKKSFISDLMLHDGRRHEQFGDDAHILEPDIKDGQGGLRDFHSILWMAAAVFGADRLTLFESGGILTAADLYELEASVDFILSARHALHKAAGRKQDRLCFEFQDRLAGMIGLSVSEIETPVEIFMRRFHQSASTIKNLKMNISFSIMETMRLNRKKTAIPVDSGICIRSGRVAFAEKNAAFGFSDMMDAFLACSRSGLELHPDAWNIIRSSRDLIVKGRSSHHAIDAFLQMLITEHPHIGLIQMLETGALERFIPEFARIRSKIQNDVYHVHTVDMHSIHTVRELKRLEREEAEIVSIAGGSKILMLAGLLHDIGKGSGGRHAATGAALAHDIALRLGIGPEDAEEVSFLVRNHLLLPHTATRRDISEEKTVFTFARAAGSVRRLCMLYLLSVADSAATGPAAWNEWKGSLFRELFVKARHFLEKGELKRMDTIRRLDTGWDDLIKKIPSNYSGRLWALPQHYLLTSETQDILRHMMLAEDVLKGKPIRIDIIPAGKHFRLTALTKDKPGLFAQLCCIMACMHLEVVSAKIFTWHNGIAVDSFELLTPWENYDGWDRFNELFERICSGNADTNTIISERSCLISESRTGKAPFQSVVKIDNESSDFFSVIEVKTGFGTDILYRISDAISRHGLSIHRAFIATDADLAVNIFYVAGDTGEKIEDKSAQAALMAAIKAAAGHPSA